MIFITIMSNNSNYNDDDGDDDSDANEETSVSAQPVCRTAKTWPAANNMAHGPRSHKP